ncbi:MAG: flagellar biosynthetic protein FliR [Syntrophus sp. (in: bacteria)]|nr:flagellar biosynthetic protein FliR [Syntrophus sp. (in: bacteria)]
MIDIGIEAQKFMLVFFRVVSVLWLVPLFSSRYVSVVFKASLSLLIAFLLYGSVNIAADILKDPFSFTLLVARELFIGITISFIVKIIFSSVAIAGDIISLQTGFSFARFMDPFTMTQVSVIEQIKNLLAIMIFFAIDAHYIVFQAIAVSFKTLPIGAATFKEPLLNYIINATTRVFSLGFKIGAPIIVTLFLVELAFGMLSRMIPQINIFIEGVPIKILITMILLTVSLSFIAPVVAGLFKGMDTDFMKVMRLMV